MRISDWSSDVCSSDLQITVSAVARQGAGKEALALVEQEYRRAVDHGFTQAEVDEQFAIRRPALRNAVAGVTTRRSATLADALAGEAEGDFVFVRPETRTDEHTSELQSLMGISYA